jgi:biotin operon repressor BirA-like protein
MTSKEQVLEFLQHNQGYYLSGEEMAAQLQLSRNAVWKAMKVLRRDGYVIDAVTKRGYRLLSQPDRLNVERIQELLERMQADRSKQEGSRSKQEDSRSKQDGNRSRQDGNRLKQDGNRSRQDGSRFKQEDSRSKQDGSRFKQEISAN